MSKEIALEFIRQLKESSYFERFRSLNMLYESTIKHLVMSSLNIKTVPLTKKMNLKYNSPDDYIPHIDFEDRSFPLDLLFKEQFERLFDADLSMVKIHTGEYSNELAAKQGAKAITIGNSIYFARGMYSPYTEEGLALLAHEIQHVVQNNDKDQFFLYDEDIALAEYMAESVETQMQNIKLHSVNSGVVNNDVTVARGNPDAYTEETKREIGYDKSLDDFTIENKEILYEITFENGKVYKLTKNERAKVIEAATQDVKEYIESKASFLSDYERDQFLIKVLKYVN